MERVVVPLNDDLAGTLSRYARRHRIHRDLAAERLLATALDERRLDRAIERFAFEDTEFTQAAAAAEIDPWRFADLLHRRALGSAAERTDTTGATD